MVVSGPLNDPRTWYKMVQNGVKCRNVASTDVRTLKVATLQTQLRSGEARIRGLERHVAELMRRVARWDDDVV